MKTFHIANLGSSTVNNCHMVAFLGLPGVKVFPNRILGKEIISLSVSHGVAMTVSNSEIFQNGIFEEKFPEAIIKLPSPIKAFLYKRASVCFMHFVHRGCLTPF